MDKFISGAVTAIVLFVAGVVFFLLCIWTGRAIALGGPWAIGILSLITIITIACVGGLIGTWAL